MQRTVVEGVFMWSVWQPDRNMPFNSFLVVDATGNLAVDPLPLSAADEAEVRGLGGIGTVVVTNADHERDVRRCAETFGAAVVVPEPDAPRLAFQPQRVVRAGDEVGPARVVAFDGLKTPGEIALHLPQRRAAIVGDALLGDPAGSLRMLPDEKLADPRRAVKSLRKLRTLRLEHLLLGDGAPIFGGAQRALGTFFSSCGGADLNRVNLDELEWRSDRDGRFAASWAEIGLLIGAERLGYLVARVPPGKSFCPFHWHTAEEELFVVWDGRPTLRTPRGEIELRRGDFAAFATAERGAHEVRNDTTEPCTIVMLANSDAGDVCYYPDSKKVLVESTGLMVRSEPALDYFDGEI